MASASLLRRLETAADPTSAGRTVYRSEDLESAVVEHLQKLLNTRQGSALTVPDYGIIELSELMHDFPDSNAIMQRCIKATIQKYEPRLRNVQVKSIAPEEDESQLLLRYEVSAQLVHPSGDRQQVRFSTQVDESSNVSIS